MRDNTNGVETALQPEVIKNSKSIIPLSAVTDNIRVLSSEVPEESIKNTEAYQSFVRSILDQQKEYPLPVPVISVFQDGAAIPLLTLKSFSLWQGKQKSKKTTALALAIASFIRGDKSNDPVQFIGSMEGDVLWFDNEQGESYAARTMKLILKLAGQEDSKKFTYCDLREFSPKERMEIIKAGIASNPNTRLVVIDGLVDLLTDFMDAGEGHATTTNILKICSQFNIHVAGVLHQNKNDKNARAHIGTISSQKCEVEISTEVDPNDRSQTQVMCVNSRGLPFDTFSIRWDKGSLPCINQEWSSEKASDTKAAKNYERSKEIAEAIFKPLSALSHADAVKAIMNTANKSESTAKRLLKDFIGWDFITKSPDGNYRAKATKGSKVHEGSKQVHEPGH